MLFSVAFKNVSLISGSFGDHTLAEARVLEDAESVDLWREVAGSQAKSQAANRVAGVCFVYVFRPRGVVTGGSREGVRVRGRGLGVARGWGSMGRVGEARACAKLRQTWLCQIP